MSPLYSVRAITHIHTRNSNGTASEMDPLIGGAIRRIMGNHALPNAWSECFTPVSALLDLLRYPHPAHPVGIVVVTDHMNSLSHRLPEELLRAAALDPRLAAGCELSCVEPDIDGALRRSPEVLVYGGSKPVPGPFGRHFGISQAILEDLYRTCRAAGSAELQTSRVMAYCNSHHLAHALAHPFDGHDLSVEVMVDLISRAKFVEVVNGGFPPESAKFLTALVELQNSAVQGFSLAPNAAARWPVAAEFVRRIQAERRGYLHPWGGSDAHIQDFDRVVIRYQAERPNPTAGDLFRTMLERPVDELLARGALAIEGQAGTSLAVLDDVVRIVARNLWRYGPRLIRSPRLAATMLMETQRVTRAELGRRALRQEQLLREVERLFPVEELVCWLEPGLARVVPAPTANDRMPIRPKADLSVVAA